MSIKPPSGFKIAEKHRLEDKDGPQLKLRIPLSGKSGTLGGKEAVQFFNQRVIVATSTDALAIRITNDIANSYRIGRSGQWGSAVFTRYKPGLYIGELGEDGWWIFTRADDKP